MELIDGKFKLSPRELEIIKERSEQEICQLLKQALDKLTKARDLLDEVEKRLDKKAKMQ